MIFSATPFEGLYVIEPERRIDDRGYFARTMCRTEFEDHNLSYNFVQANESYNRTRGTLRGMHYQRDPHSETKLVRCVRGAIFDVIIDLRPGSATYRQWKGFDLTAENGRSLYIPGGFAHGYMTLTDNAIVDYQVSSFYAPEAAAGVRYDDPAISIQWPLPATNISPQDQQWPLLG